MYQAIGLNALLVKIRNIGGFRSDNVFCKVRIPNWRQNGKDEISLVILDGRGLFCIDVKDWSGEVTLHVDKWHIKPNEEYRHADKTSKGRVADPIKAIKAKADNLLRYLQCNGVFLDPSYLFPRVLLLSPDCQMSFELRFREEVVTHASLDAFLLSFRKDFVAGTIDAFTPSWISGHLSYRQLQDTGRALNRTYTWDTVRLRDGQQLRGEYQACQHLLVHRQETEEMEFSESRVLEELPAWEWLGLSRKVTVTMYQRAGQGRLFRPTTSISSIPYSSQVSFRTEGENVDTHILVSNIQSITLRI